MGQFEEDLIYSTQGNPGEAPPYICHTYRALAGTVSPTVSSGRRAALPICRRAPHKILRKSWPSVDDYKYNGTMASKIKAVLIDLSGTLHIDNTVIPGAVEALSRLRKTNATVKFVTNTTKESKKLLHNRLTSLGFDIKKEEIFSSLAAARELIVKRKLNPFFLVDEAAIEDFEDLRRADEEVNAVVVGLAPDKFYYDVLNQAFRLLLKGACLIAIHEGRYYKRPDGLALGPGTFVKGLEYSANVKAEVVGKPTQAFFAAALNGIDPREAIMIGDDVRDDVGGAQAAGLRGILVQTGKFRAGDEATITPPPYKICPSFVEAVDAIIDEM